MIFMIKLLIASILLLLFSLKPLVAGVDKGIDVGEVQKMLTELCFKPGSIDGVWGNRTESAFKEFYKSFGKYDGKFDNVEMALLSERYTVSPQESRCKTKGLKIIDNALSIDLPTSEYIRGVSQEQWNIIKEIGDPQNCERRVEDLRSLKDGVSISADEFNKQPANTKAKMNENKVIFFESGTYKLKDTIKLIGKTLIGNPKTLIDASRVKVAFQIDNGGLKNVRIVNAQKRGVDLLENATVNNVIVDKTGIGFENNTNGFGVSMKKTKSKNNCIVSVEVSNGYNEAGNSCCKKGGNADGFRVTYGAHNVTFVDAHSHHNSDDGFDFWKGGHTADIEFNETSYRIFYSSANLNGKNPFANNGDGNGYKLGSPDHYDRPRKDAGSKLIYGSVACYNASNGFDSNGTRTKIISSKIEAFGNRGHNYQKVYRNLKTDKDPNVLRCNMFPTR